MKQFLIVIEKGEKYFIGHCPEVPGANGQGDTVESCKENTKEAIELILEDLLEDGLRDVSSDAIRETVVVK